MTCKFPYLCPFNLIKFPCFYRNQFDIVPILENDKNKNPVLYEHHNVGLEMWCVKHVYAYIHPYLLKIRKQLKRNLSQSEVEKVNRLLLGAVLLQPDVSTFWNMRRELIELNLVKASKDLLLTKLVLSYKSKSNEAFSHRRWIARRMLKQFSTRNIQDIETLMEKEFLVANMACQKVSNNYHAWTYKIWLIENIPDLNLKSSIIQREFSSSLDWVFFNVSEHSGFHYRQRLLLLVQQHVLFSDNYFREFKQFLASYLHIMNYSIESFLKCLLGTVISKSDDRCVSLLCLLLFELLYTCQELNKSYPGHESIWYHRRFVLHSLLHTVYRFFNLEWIRNVNVKDTNLNKNSNIIRASLADSGDYKKLQENGEKFPKLFKAEPRIVENTFLYKLLLKTETDFVNNNIICTNIVQSDLAKKHENWLKHIMQIQLNS